MTNLVVEAHPVFYHEGLLIWHYITVLFLVNCTQEEAASHFSCTHMLPCLSALQGALGKEMKPKPLHMNSDEGR